MYSWPKDVQFLHVGDLTVDLRHRRVISPEDSVELQQRVFDLLLLLLDEPQKLHTRAELFERLWAGLVVDDANLSQSMWLLRKALGPSRRDWVRTVAKRGYIFQPPGRLSWPSASTWLETGGKSPVAEVAEFPVPPIQRPDRAPERTGQLASAPVGESPDEGPGGPVHAYAGPARRRLIPARLRTRRAALALLSFAMLGGLLVTAWLLRGDRAPAGQTSVALVSLQPEAGADLVWSTVLLHEWLQWKLASLPDLDLMSASDLASTTAGRSPKVVFLSTVHTGPHQVTIRARIKDGDTDDVLEQTGTLAHLPGLIDRVSRDALARVAPGRQDAWPALEIDLASAQRYQEAAAAYRIQDWLAVSSVGERIIKDAPRFGLMHLQLADAQSRISRTTSAIEHHAVARHLLRPVPHETSTLLEAQGLSMDPRRLMEALKIFEKLITSSPRNIDYHLRYIDLLISAGRYQQALSMLVQPTVARDGSRSLQVRRHMLLSRIHNGLGDADQALREAEAARKMALGAPNHAMALDVGNALLIEAGIQSLRSTQKAATLYAEAARVFEQAGDATHALYARTLETINQTRQPGDEDALKVALASVHEAGYRTLEVNILVTLANNASGASERSSWLEQALAVAQEAGDLTAQGEIEAALIMEEIGHMRFDQAEARALHMQDLGLEGLAGNAINTALASVYYFTGRNSQALKVLESIQVSLDGKPSDASTALFRAEHGCRIGLHLLHAGDLTRARAEIHRCSLADSAELKFRAGWTSAILELYAGNRAAAIKHYEQARVLLVQGHAVSPVVDPVNFSYFTVRLAYVATRIGDVGYAETLYQQQRPFALQHGDPMLLALIDIGLAETAAAAGNWKASRTLSAMVRPMLRNGAWELEHRMDLLAMADAIHANDLQRAREIGKRVYHGATGTDDVRLQLAVLSMVSAEDLALENARTLRTSLVARTGMRGLTMRWLQNVSKEAPEAVPSAAGPQPVAEASPSRPR